MERVETRLLAAQPVSTHSAATAFAITGQAGVVVSVKCTIKLGCILNLWWLNVVYKALNVKVNEGHVFQISIRLFFFPFISPTPEK